MAVIDKNKNKTKTKQKQNNLSIAQMTVGSCQLSFGPTFCPVSPFEGGGDDGSGRGNSDDRGGQSGGGGRVEREGGKEGERWHGGELAVTHHTSSEQAVTCHGNGDGYADSG